MFGSNYWQKPELIFRQGKGLGLGNSFPLWLRPLVPFYVKVFGIPEIGFQIRALKFRQALKKIKFASALDAGCGLGIYSHFLSRHNPKAKIDAFDLDREMIKICRRMYTQENINFFSANIQQLTLKRKYDLIVCIDVLEHVDNWKKSIQNLRSLLKKNGKLLLHVPLMGQRRHFPSFHEWEHHTHKEQGLSEKELVEFLKNNSFKLLLRSGDHRFFGSLAWELNMLLMKHLFLAALLYPFIYLLMLLDEIFPSQKYNCLLLVAKK